MSKIIGKTRIDKLGTVLFELDAGKFFAKTSYRTLEITDSNTKIVRGRTFLDTSAMELPGNVAKIEIPNDVLIEKKKALEDSIAMKGSICRVEHGPEGAVYFSIGENAELVLKNRDKVLKFTDTEIVCGRPAVNIKEFGFKHEFIEVPTEVMVRHVAAKRRARFHDYELVEAGTSPFNGETYYKTAPPVDLSKVSAEVRALFENFGDKKSGSEMYGFLTKYKQEALTLLNGKQYIEVKK